MEVYTLKTIVNGKDVFTFSQPKRRIIYLTFMISTILLATFSILGYSGLVFVMIVPLSVATIFGLFDIHFEHKYINAYEDEHYANKLHYENEKLAKKYGFKLPVK